MSRHLAVVALAGLAAVAALANELPNGGFESGLSGWTTGGTAHVEALQSGNFRNPIAPTEGTWLALLSTGPGDFGGPAGSYDGNGTTDYEQATLSVTFTVATEATVSFDWLFLTSEVNQPAQYDDLMAADVDGAHVLTHSAYKSTTFSPFPNTVVPDYVDYDVTSTGPTNGSGFPVTGGSGGRTPWASFSTVVAAGSHTLTFWVSDQGDRNYDSGLVVDDVSVRPNADLAVTKDDGLSQVNPGQPLTYTVVVSNAGPAAVSGATVSDLFPATLLGVTWTCAGAGGGSCTAAGSGNVADSVSLPVGASVTYTVGATLSGSATGSLTNTATVTAPADRVDPDPSDNSATDSDTVTEGAEQVTVTSGGNLVTKGGGLVWTPATSSLVRIAGNGSLVAFVSTADLTGGNPDLGNEVFTFAPAAGAVQQITDVASPVAFLHVDGLDISQGGQYLAFSSAADLLGSNPDWNTEVFLRNLSTGATTQVTSTSGCANRSPSVNNNGTRVAFTTDCADLVAGFNADRNQEMVVWISGTGYRRCETTGCSSRTPSLSRDNNGRYVAFVSDCNLVGSGNTDHNLEIFWRDNNSTNCTTNTVQVTTTTAPVVSDSPSASANGTRVAFVSSGNFTGGNGDGSLEVFRWRSNSTYVQVTATPATTYHLAVAMDPSYAWVAYERLDLLAGGSAIVTEPAGGGAETVLMSGDVRLPALGRSGTTNLVAFESSEDTGANPDGNVEVWLAR